MTNSTLNALTALVEDATCRCLFAYAGPTCDIRYDDYLAPYFDPYRYTIAALNVLWLLMNLAGLLVLLRRKRISSEASSVRLGQWCLAMLCCESTVRIIHMVVYFDLTPAGERATHVIPFVFLNHAFLFFFYFWLGLQQPSTAVVWMKAFFTKLDVIAHIVMVVSIAISVFYPAMLLVFFVTYGVFAILAFSVYDYYALKLRREMRTHSQRLSLDVSTNTAGAAKSRDLLRRFTIAGLVGSVGVSFAVLGFSAVAIFDMERHPWQFYWSEVFFFSVELVFQSLIMYLFHPLFNDSMTRSMFMGLLLNPGKVEEEERSRRRHEASVASVKESQMRNSSAAASLVEDTSVDANVSPEPDLLAADESGGSSSGAGMSRTRSSRRAKSRSSSTRRKHSLGHAEHLPLASSPAHHATSSPPDGAIGGTSGPALVLSGSSHSRPSRSGSASHSHKKSSSP